MVGASHWLTPFARSFFVPVVAAALLELVVAWKIVGIPQATHFYQRVAIPLTSIAGTIALFAYLAARIPRWAGTASLAAILSIFALVAVKQVRSAHALAAWRVAQQADRDVDALLGAVPTPDVVGIWDLRTNAVSAARVARWRFFAYRWRSQIPPQEDRQRYVFLSKLTGKGWDEVNAELSHPLDDFVRRVELEGSDAKERAALKVFYATADRSFLLARRLDWLVLPGTSVPDAIRRASEMGLSLRQMRRRGDHALMKVAIDHEGARSP